MSSASSTPIDPSVVELVRTSHQLRRAIQPLPRNVVRCCRRSSECILLSNTISIEKIIFNIIGAKIQQLQSYIQQYTSRTRNIEYIHRRGIIGGLRSQIFIPGDSRGDILPSSNSNNFHPHLPPLFRSSIVDQATPV